MFVLLLGVNVDYHLVIIILRYLQNMRFNFSFISLRTVNTLMFKKLVAIAQICLDNAAANLVGQVFHFKGFVCMDLDLDGLLERSVCTIPG